MATLDLFAASIVAVSSEVNSGVRGNPLEKRTKVFRPGTVIKFLQRERMARSIVRAPKLASRLGTGKPPSDAATTAAPTEAPSVATEDIGSASDEQLIQAIDILRGMTVVGRRAAG